MLGDHDDQRATATTATTTAIATRIATTTASTSSSAPTASTSHPMIDWARRLVERRGRLVAAAALARKLAGILFAMWRNGTSYPSSAARRRCSTPNHPIRSRNEPR
jgi:hypothetical protein